MIGFMDNSGGSTSQRIQHGMKRTGDEGSLCFQIDKNKSSVGSIFVPAEGLAGPDGPAPLVSNLCTAAIGEGKRETQARLISFSSSEFYADV